MGECSNAKCAAFESREIVARMSEATSGKRPAYRGVYHRAALGADPLAHAGYMAAWRAWRLASRWRRPPTRRDDRIEAVGQCCRAGLQDQRRFDLDDAVVAHGRDRIPTRALA